MPINQLYVQNEAIADYISPSAAHRLMRTLVVLAAVGLAALVLYIGPLVAMQITNIVFSTSPSVLPLWMKWTLYAFYTSFVVGSLFPLFLVMGWRVLATARPKSVGTPPYVSLIIPVFNEEGGISRSLQAACALDYPTFEIIVVDDGSTDLTLPLIETNPVVCIRFRTNRGKAHALNAGIERAKGDIIVISDSDSFLDQACLRYLTGHFEDPTVGAVAGMVFVHRTSTLLTCWQALEYVFGQNVVKMAQLGSGSSVTICPGPVSAFRRDVLEAIGGFKDRTLTEDFDLTLDVIESGYSVLYEPRAVAYTEVPESWRKLKQQRLRWAQGHLQVLRRHRAMLFSRRLGRLGLFWLPHLLIAGYGGPIIELGIILLLPLLVYSSGIPVQFLEVAIIFAIMLELLNIIQYVAALTLARQLRARLLLSILIIHPYRIFLVGVRLLAIMREIRGAVASW